MVVSMPVVVFVIVPMPVVVIVIVPMPMIVSMPVNGRSPVHNINRQGSLCVDDLGEESQAQQEHSHLERSRRRHYQRP